MLLSLTVAAAIAETVTAMTLERHVGSHKPLEYWKKGARAPAGALHEVIVRAVPLASRGELEALLLERSIPGSARFREWMSTEEVKRVGGASELGATERWLKLGVGARTKATKHGEYVRAIAPVAAWEGVFACEFYAWHHHEEKKTVLRCDGDYSIESGAPAEAVFGVSDLPPRVWGGPRRRDKTNKTLDNIVTPSVINSFYEISSNAGSSKVYQGVFETSGMDFSGSDLSDFQSLFDLPSDKVDTDYGGHESDIECEIDADECDEGNLDVQYMMAVSQLTPMTYYYTDASSPFVAFALYAADLDTQPFVGSISWGSIESEMTDEVLEAFDVELVKATLAGSTFFVSSGDDGVANFAAYSKADCGYVPSYPATSPYVVAVGATYASSYDDPGVGEVVCESDVDDAIITSGGGFSTYYAQPNFTLAAISDYFDQVAPVSGYNASGRAYPDLALSGYDYLVVIGGAEYYVSGTSCSSPTVAAMASLVNAVRVEAGASGLGYVLPSIYAQNGSFTNDITSGSNNCVAEDEFCCDQGFDAATGWDPVTGWGSVDYAKFEAVFTSDLDPLEVARAKSRLNVDAVRPLRAAAQKQ
ncbi:hypothetical protein CTAYLR_009025 [Chrysophaeum taylorii]|uniref:subtilisin n=1 Tax=Chrysophaeum taylorii TaxID=2483200 RepID=A0AAD7XPB6_9STRA|nr:hypothetical protein CTAYLR_009025 [Chrysophaeum taylorii]